MSVNKRTRILRRIKDSQGADRELEVFEEDNSQDLVNATTLYANTYSRITFEYEYKESEYDDPDTFFFADVYVTNRFTMDTYKKTPPIYFDPGSNSFISIPNTHSYFRARVDTTNKRTILEVVLSMADFMFGDIYVQFYRDANDKEQYCAPIIVQFTNAPTVCVSNIYKWNPNSATKLSDEDTVFTSSFGSTSACVPDTGRADVLTSNAPNAEYYNDFMSAHRLITNGLAKDETHSFSGHPVYTIEYTAFVPSAFSEQFGYVTSSVAFSAINNEHGYLTSAVDNWQTMQTDKLNLNMYLQDTDRTYQLSAVKSSNNTITTIGGVKQTFVTHLTAAPGDKQDEWFRQHTRACADFVLSGLDPYWTGESDELPPRIRLVYSQREFAGLDDKYVPPVFELAWYATGAPTHYYLLKKGGNRNNDSDWIHVFDPHDYQKYLPHYGDIRVVNYIYKEGDPWQSFADPRYGIIVLTPENYHIRNNLPEIELDENKRPIIKMYFEGTGSIWYSDGADAANHFKILDEEEKNGLKVIAIRTSDIYVDFDPEDADAEFMILYNV